MSKKSQNISIKKRFSMGPTIPSVESGMVGVLSENLLEIKRQKNIWHVEYFDILLNSVQSNKVAISIDLPPSLQDRRCRTSENVQYISRAEYGLSTSPYIPILQKVFELDRIPHSTKGLCTADYKVYLEVDS
jgi:hypothetical protein